MNARQCGCDPDCQPRAWYCLDFPNCVYGIELNLNDNPAGGITHMNENEQEAGGSPAPPDAVAEPADAAAEPAAAEAAPEAPVEAASEPAAE